MPETKSGQELAEGLRDIYDRFLQALEEAYQKTQKKSFGKQVAAGAMQWVAGSYIKNERQLLCLQFQKEVKEQLAQMESALETEDEAKVSCALETAVDILTEPVNPRSNTTADLMIRAMILEAKPYLSQISEAKRRKILIRLERAYTRLQWLPVEEEVIKELYRLSAETNNITDQ